MPQASQPEKGEIVKTYAVISPDFGPQFAITANDDEDADGKCFRWCRYHGFLTRDTRHRVEEIDPADMPQLRIEYHNEWVPETGL